MDDYSQALNRLNERFATGATLSVAWRRQQLQQLQKFLHENRSALSNALQTDLGKHPSESALTELDFLPRDIRHTLSQLPKWMRARRVSTPLMATPGSSYLVPEPLGTVLILGAWNYPVQLLLAPLVAALAAGNCALIKPSEHAQKTASIIAERLPNYLQSDVVKVVTGEADVAAQLTAMPFDHIFYTGGANAARKILHNAADNLVPVTLELGGKSPAVVYSDADIKVTARRLVWGKFLNAGQTCIAPDYVLVDDSVKAELMSAMVSCIREFYGEEPQNSDDYGRLIHQRHYQRLHDFLSSADVVFGGDCDKQDRYIGPTLIVSPDLESPLMQEEIFGPLLPIIGFSELPCSPQQFIRQRPKPLALYLFTHSKANRRDYARAVSAGSLCINDTLIFMMNDQLPFGGVGNSGMGRYHGYWGFETFSHIKSVMKRSFWFDVVLRYPPYSSLKDKLLRWFT